MLGLDSFPKIIVLNMLVNPLDPRVAVISPVLGGQSSHSSSVSLECLRSLKVFLPGHLRSSLAPLSLESQLFVDILDKIGQIFMFLTCHHATLSVWYKSESGLKQLKPVIYKFLLVRDIFSKSSGFIFLDLVVLPRNMFPSRSIANS